MLVPYRYLLTIIQNLEVWLYIFQFLISGIIPENIFILFIKLLGIIDIFKYTNSEIMGKLSVPGLYFIYNPIALLSVSGTYHAKSGSS